jgi:hypothetical protein
MSTTRASTYTFKTEDYVALGAEHQVAEPPRIWISNHLIRPSSPLTRPVHRLGADCCKRQAV